jgi:CRP/FNR family transcriptional regulator, cyclic AMP receptor protein
MAAPKSGELKAMLRRAPWAAGLGAAELQAVESELQERHVDAGTTVWHEGAPAEHWMGIVDGMVKVQSIDAAGRTTVFIGVSTGGWLGEGSVIKGERLRFDVVALETTHLALMPAATFHRLLQTHLPFNHFLIAQLNARLGQFLGLTESQRTRDADAQVALCVAELFNPELNPQPHRDIHFSQEEIGRLAGLSRQVAGRALHRLEREGLVSVRHGGIEVLDVAGLRRWGR